MRVLHTVAGLNEVFGGPSRSVPALCDGLATNCEWIGLASQTFHNLNSPIIRPQDERIELVLCPAKYFRKTRLAFSWTGRSALDRLLRERAVDLVHDHGLWHIFNHSAASAARSAGVPRVVSPRGTLMQWSLESSALRKSIALRLFQRRDLEDAAGFVATSKQEAIDLRCLGLKQAIAVVPNGVATYSETPRRDGGGVRTIGFLSRLHPKKALPKLLHAWAKIRPVGWRLVIAGPDEGNHRTELRELADTLSITDRVEFREEIPETEKRAFLASCEVITLPSEAENFGMIVAEALAMGIPVIASHGTPWSELPTTGSGWWVSNTELELAGALADATSQEPAVLQAMGQRGRELVQREYSWSAVATRISTFYAWLLNGGSKPSFLFD